MAFIIKIVINLICGIIVMIIHELPKNIAAHFLTHPIHRPRRIKFITPKKFIDPIGLILFAVSSVGVGWQKPYEYNPNKLTDKHKSFLPIMLTGLLANFLAMMFLIPLFSVMQTYQLNEYLLYFIQKLFIFNFMIFLVNLIPVPPLDMSYIIYAYSPDNYFKLIQNQRYIHSAFILVIAFGLIESIGIQLLSMILNIFS